MHFRLTPLFLAAACLLASGASGIELPGMFSAHAVLQRGVAVPVWGWGTPGEEVEIRFAGQTEQVEVDVEGRWRLELGPMDPSAEGQVLVAKGSESGQVVVEDILVGEVWMASGQSNMQWALSATERARKDIPTANHPGIRMFLADLTTSAIPRRRVGGEWNVTTPQSAGKFSAVGYYFALKLHAELGVPVGIIRTAWGGKPAEAFTSRETLATEPEGRALLQKLDAEMRRFDLGAAEASYKKQVASWEKIRSSNRVEKDPKKRQKLPRKPQQPRPPALNPSRPAAIYNGMIHPWTGYAMRGAIWYQGESNASRAKAYETLFPLLIMDWRERWNSEMPFYFAQLASFKSPTARPGQKSPWAELQNAQRLALRLPKTGMAVLNDVGAANDIHPRNKRDVGERLSRWALREEYGQKDLVASGPLYRGFKVEDRRIRITFDNAVGLATSDGNKPARFEIAGEDRIWRWADVVLDGESAIVSSREVPDPVAVRYAWASNPKGANLVNAAGLPASLFRTDSWKLSTQR